MKAVSSSFTMCKVSHVVIYRNRRTLTLVIAIISWLDRNFAAMDPKTSRPDCAVLLGDGAEQDVRDCLLARAYVDRTKDVLDHGAGKASLNILVGGVEVDIGDANDAATRRLGNVDCSAHSVIVWILIEQRC